ncbi:MATE family efflux transporter [Marinobacterium rhizophilum]|uniref:MATE family efflux transporter n=1 Tax=Marinobacterium rhizophilum TaxID=420402 RepID=A0ABY5HM34_9GAMM|nr:MATE family efflux transporter [Marinobacterium rhizophilum]UTW13360.1 MATE family efflux transporter [Marinobacterium rhizophilum]
MTLSSAPLGRQLYRMTWPMLIGLVSILSCQLVDSAFIGQLGVQPLVAVSLSIPVYQLIVGLQVGLGIAITAIISTENGARNHAYAQEFGLLVIATGVVLVAIVGLLLWCFQASIMSFLGAHETLYPLVKIYWLPWLISCWLGAMLHIGYSIFRAHGDTGVPGMVMLLSSIINIVLDPLFIFTFDWGLAGAAWATCVAFVAGNAILYHRLWTKRLICWPQTSAQQAARLKRLLNFMAPATLSQFLPPLAAMLATIAVASHGDTAIAAWGLGVRLEFFSLIIVLALTMAMPPMIGSLRGRGDLDGILQLVGMALRFVLFWQLTVAILLFLGASTVSGVLTRDVHTAALLSEFLWLVPVSFGPLGLCMIVVSVCSAVGMPRLALIVSAVRLFGCYLPLLWVGSELAGLTGLFVGAMAGNLLAGLMSWNLYGRLCKTLRSGHMLNNRSQQQVTLQTAP